uniref:RING-type domain-containing protein n=1 Tax=Macrostomum lignano TaxID=282301 RepID=A0A1I8FHQ2_9PLAT
PWELQKQKELQRRPGCKSCRRCLPITADRREVSLQLTHRRNLDGIKQQQSLPPPPLQPCPALGQATAEAAAEVIAEVAAAAAAAAVLRAADFNAATVATYVPPQAVSCVAATAASSRRRGGGFGGSGLDPLMHEKAAKAADIIRRENGWAVFCDQRRKPTDRPSNYFLVLNTQMLALIWCKFKSNTSAEFSTLTRAISSSSRSSSTSASERPRARASSLGLHSRRRPTPNESALRFIVCGDRLPGPELLAQLNGIHAASHGRGSSRTRPEAGGQDSPRPAKRGHVQRRPAQRIGDIMRRMQRRGGLTRCWRAQQTGDGENADHQAAVSSSHGQMKQRSTVWRSACPGGAPRPDTQPSVCLGRDGSFHLSNGLIDQGLSGVQAPAAIAQLQWTPAVEIDRSQDGQAGRRQQTKCRRAVGVSGQVRQGGSVFGHASCQQAEPADRASVEQSVQSVRTLGGCGVAYRRQAVRVRTSDDLPSVTRAPRRTAKAGAGARQHSQVHRRPAVRILHQRLARLAVQSNVLGSPDAAAQWATVRPVAGSLSNGQQAGLQQQSHRGGLASFRSRVEQPRWRRLRSTEHQLGQQLRLARSGGCVRRCFPESALFPWRSVCALMSKQLVKKHAPSASSDTRTIKAQATLRSVKQQPDRFKAAAASWLRESSVSAAVPAVASVQQQSRMSRTTGAAAPAARLLQRRCWRVKQAFDEALAAHRAAAADRERPRCPGAGRARAQLVKHGDRLLRAASASPDDGGWAAVVRATSRNFQAQKTGQAIRRSRPGLAQCTCRDGGTAIVLQERYSNIELTAIGNLSVQLIEKDAPEGGPWHPAQKRIESRDAEARAGVEQCAPRPPAAATCRGAASLLPDAADAAVEDALAVAGSGEGRRRAIETASNAAVGAGETFSSVSATRRQRPQQARGSAVKKLRQSADTAGFSRHVSRRQAGLHRAATRRRRRSSPSRDCRTSTTGQLPGRSRDRQGASVRTAACSSGVAAAADSSDSIASATSWLPTTRAASAGVRPQSSSASTASKLLRLSRAVQQRLSAAAVRAAPIKAPPVSPSRRRRSQLGVPDAGASHARASRLRRSPTRTGRDARLTPNSKASTLPALSRRVQQRPAVFGRAEISPAQLRVRRRLASKARSAGDVAPRSAGRNRKVRPASRALRRGTAPAFSGASSRRSSSARPSRCELAVRQASRFLPRHCRVQPRTPRAHAVRMCPLKSR